MSRLVRQGVLPETKANKGIRKDGSIVLGRVSGPTARVIAGVDSLDDWDEEELERGRRRDKNGGWTGKPTRLVPTDVHKELIRRKLKEATELLKTAAPEAVRVLMTIMDDTLADASTRVQACKIVLDRAFGPVGHAIDLNIKTPLWVEALKGGIVPGDYEALADEIIDVDSEEVA